VNRSATAEALGAPELTETVVKLYRCSKVMRGGKRFSAAALVVVGDARGRVGLGYGKANEIPRAVEKAAKDARKNLFEVPLKGATVPHAVLGRYKASNVLLRPAAPGTGVIAGSSIRPVLEAAGIRDVLTKVYGARNAKNAAKAAVDGLRQLKERGKVEILRGVKLT
jgi:small subunit ribosomal protein S5